MTAVFLEIWITDELTQMHRSRQYTKKFIISDLRMEADSLEDVTPEGVAWKTLSITHVEYPVGDKVFLA